MQKSERGKKKEEGIELGRKVIGTGAGKMERRKRLLNILDKLCNKQTLPEFALCQTCWVSGRP